MSKLVDISDNIRLTSLNTKFNGRQVTAFSSIGLNTVGDLSDYMVDHKYHEMLMLNDIAEHAIYMCLLLMKDFGLSYHKDYVRWENEEYAKSPSGIKNMKKIDVRRKQAKENDTEFTYGRAGRMKGTKKSESEKEKERLSTEKSIDIIKHYFTTGYDPVETCKAFGYKKTIDYPTSCSLIEHHRSKLKTLGIYAQVLKELGMEPDDMRDRALSTLNDSLNAIKHEWIGKHIVRDQKADLLKIAPELTDNQVSAILMEQFIIDKVYKMSIEVADHKIRNEAVKIMGSVFPQPKSESGANPKVAKNPEEAMEQLIEQTKRMIDQLQRENPEALEVYIEKLRKRYAA